VELNLLKLQILVLLEKFVLSHHTQITFLQDGMFLVFEVLKFKNLEKHDLCLCYIYADVFITLQVLLKYSAVVVQIFAS